jgi:thiosulfate dehydrogenase [quinone] large subunit
MSTNRATEFIDAGYYDTAADIHCRHQSNLWSFIVQHLGLTSIYLLPIRLFIGLGWIRAGIEKLIDPEWRSGVTLSGFLNEHVTREMIAFPVYQALTTSVSLPHASVLAWIVVAGQLLVGVAILTGTLTNAALIAGLFMNVNFLLIGEPTPSVFYIIIQIALLVSNAGYVFGIDARLSRYVHQPLLCAQPATCERPWFRRRTAAIGAGASTGIALYGLLHVTDFSPGGSVSDSAMILTVIASLLAMWFAISYLRQVFELPSGPVRVAGGEEQPAMAEAQPTLRRP